MRFSSIALAVIFSIGALTACAGHDIMDNESDTSTQMNFQGSRINYTNSSDTQVVPMLNGQPFLKDVPAQKILGIKYKGASTEEIVLERGENHLASIPDAKNFKRVDASVKVEREGRSIGFIHRCFNLSENSDEPRIFTFAVDASMIRQLLSGASVGRPCDGNPTKK
jgi:hypothetical protein